MKEEDNIRVTRQFFFRHFAQRLSERYSLLITFEYYDLLCDVWIKRPRPYKGSTKVLEGFIIVHGVKVKVLRRMTDKVLLTALPMEYSRKRKKKKR